MDSLGLPVEAGAVVEAVVAATAGGTVVSVGAAQGVVVVVVEPSVVLVVVVDPVVLVVDPGAVVLVVLVVLELVVVVLDVELVLVEVGTVLVVVVELVVVLVAVLVALCVQRVVVVVEPGSVELVALVAAGAIAGDTAPAPQAKIKKEKVESIAMPPATTNVRRIRQTLPAPSPSFRPPSAILSVVVGRCNRSYLGANVNFMQTTFANLDSKESVKS